jgi:hypothetical protein
MTRCFPASSLILGLLLLAATESRAAWQADLRLTNDPNTSSTSFSNAWCVAASGDTVYAVWDDDRDGNLEIYLKRSTDGGVNWGADTRLTNNVGQSSHPSIAITGAAVQVVWRDNRDGNAEIYTKRSPDGGVSWGTDTRLSVNTSASEFPSVAVAGLAIHVVWRDFRTNNDDIYYRRSTDGGVSWGAETALTIVGLQSEEPSVAVSGAVVHVAWYEFPNDDIFYKRSLDGGDNWEAAVRLSASLAGNTFDESIAASGPVVHLIWRDNRDGNFEIYYKRSPDSGANWGPDTRLTFDAGSSVYPSVAASAEAVYTAWADSRMGSWEIYAKRSADGGLSWGDDTRLTENEYFSEYPSIAASGSAAHVVWQDNRDGNREIYTKRDPGLPSAVGEPGLGASAGLGLRQGYPNPLRPSTLMTIAFSLPSAGPVRLAVYDVQGREVATLVSGPLESGAHARVFDAKDLTSGVYFYRLEAGGLTETKKFSLMK